MIGVDLENFPLSTSAKEMLHYISEDFYEKSYVFKWILQVMGLEWDEAKTIIVDELAKQFFIETATWGLRYHEEKWGLPVREHLSCEERRKFLYEKRDYKAPMTPYAMEQYIKAVVPGIQKAHVMDCHDPGNENFSPDHPNEFKVVLVADTLDAGNVIPVLNKIKQSHTVFTLECRKSYEMEGKTTLAGVVLKKTTVIVSTNTENTVTLHGRITDGAVVSSRIWRNIN